MSRIPNNNNNRPIVHTPHAAQGPMSTNHAAPPAPPPTQIKKNYVLKVFIKFLQHVVWPVAVCAAPVVAIVMWLGAAPILPYLFLAPIAVSGAIAVFACVTLFVIRLCNIFATAHWRNEALRHARRNATENQAANAPPKASFGSDDKVQSSIDHNQGNQEQVQACNIIAVPHAPLGKIVGKWNLALSGWNNRATIGTYAGGFNDRAFVVDDHQMLDSLGFHLGVSVGGGLDSAAQLGQDSRQLKETYDILGIDASGAQAVHLHKSSHKHESIFGAVSLAVTRFIETAIDLFKIRSYGSFNSVDIEHVTLETLVNNDTAAESLGYGRSALQNWFHRAYHILFQQEPLPVHLRSSIQSNESILSYLYRKFFSPTTNRDLFLRDLLSGEARTYKITKNIHYIGSVGRLSMFVGMQKNISNHWIIQERQEGDQWHCVIQIKANDSNNVFATLPGYALADRSEKYEHVYTYEYVCNIKDTNALEQRHKLLEALKNQTYLDATKTASSTRAILDEILLKPEGILQPHRRSYPLEGMPYASYVKPLIVDYSLGIQRIMPIMPADYWEWFTQPMRGFAFSFARSVSNRQVALHKDDYNETKIIQEVSHKSGVYGSDTQRIECCIQDAREDSKQHSNSIILSITRMQSRATPKRVQKVLDNIHTLFDIKLNNGADKIASMPASSKIVTAMTLSDARVASLKVTYQQNDIDRIAKKTHMKPKALKKFLNTLQNEPLPESKQAIMAFVKTYGDRGIAAIYQLLPDKTPDDLSIVGISDAYNRPHMLVREMQLRYHKEGPKESHTATNIRQRFRDIKDALIEIAAIHQRAAYDPFLVGDIKHNIQDQCNQATITLQQLLYPTADIENNAIRHMFKQSQPWFNMQRMGLWHRWGVAGRNEEIQHFFDNFDTLQNNVSTCLNTSRSNVITYTDIQREKQALLKKLHQRLDFLQHGGSMLIDNDRRIREEKQVTQWIQQLKNTVFEKTNFVAKRNINETPPDNQRKLLRRALKRSWMRYFSPKARSLRREIQQSMGKFTNRNAAIKAQIHAEAVINPQQKIFYAQKIRHLPDTDKADLEKSLQDKTDAYHQQMHKKLYKHLQRAYFEQYAHEKNILTEHTKQHHVQRSFSMLQDMMEKLEWMKSTHYMPEDTPEYQQEKDRLDGYMRIFKQAFQKLGPKEQDAAIAYFKNQKRQDYANILATYKIFSVA